MHIIDNGRAANSVRPATNFEGLGDQSFVLNVLLILWYYFDTKNEKNKNTAWKIHNTGQYGHENHRK